MDLFLAEVAHLQSIEVAQSDDGEYTIRDGWAKGDHRDRLLIVMRGCYAPLSSAALLWLAPKRSPITSTTS